MHNVTRKTKKKKLLTLLIVSKNFQESTRYVEFIKTDSGREDGMDKSIICYLKLFEGLNTYLILKACDDYMWPVTKCLCCVHSHIDDTEFLR